MKGFPEFILASGSPQRQQLLRQAGYRFRVVAPRLSEPPSLPQAAAPAQLAEARAYFKARAVASAAADRIVVGADTIVWHQGRVFGKAADADEARRMLAAISGTRHAVTTGLAVLAPAEGDWPGQRRYLASATTYLTMRALTEAEIQRYVASGEWRDKAGAYAVQESADQFVQRIEGSFTNVVGLPMELLERMLTAVCRDLGEKTR